MENYVILKDQLSDSSHWVSESHHNGRVSYLTFDAHKGRLNRKGIGSWTPALNKHDKDQWLQVYFGVHSAKVTRIATQGNYMYEEWVTSYKLQYGDDGEQFYYYKEPGKNTDKVNKTYCNPPKIWLTAL